MFNIENIKNNYSGLVWILSAASLVIYGILSLTNQSLPGVEQLVAYTSTVSGPYIFAAAFLTILIEGLYIIGSFFPGSSIVAILALLSQTGGTILFLITIFVIFVGWSIAGVINIFFAKTYHLKILKKTHDPDYLVIGRPWTTWFPVFRANYEVAQIVEGGNPYKVLLSSIKVKFFVSLVMMVIIFIMTFIIDINELSNEEGLVTLFIIAAISFAVGVIKIKKSSQNQRS